MTTINLQSLFHVLQSSYQGLLGWVNSDAGDATGNVGNVGNVGDATGNVGENTSTSTSTITIVVALSGGKDSVFLLHTLQAYLKGGLGTGDDAGNACISGSSHNVNLVACHVNHNLRPNSHRDEQFCEHLCKTMGVPFHAIHLSMLDEGDTGNLLVKHLGVEGAARTLRYNAMGAYAHSIGARVVVTAHTRNDNVESLLLDMLTGTSLVTMGGVRPYLRWRLPDEHTAHTAHTAHTHADYAAITIARPLLGVSTGEVLSYLHHHVLSFVHDATNDDPSFKRNLIRSTLAPIIPEISGAVERLQAESIAMQGYLHQRTAHVVKVSEFRRFTLCIHKLKTLNLIEKKYIIMVQMSRLFRVESRHFDEVQRLLDNSAKNGGSISINLPDGYLCEVSYDVFAVYHTALLSPYSVDKPAGVRRVFIPRGGVQNGVEVCFSGDLAKQHLTVRTRQSGDRMQPYYTHDGKQRFPSKKGSIKELLITKKVNTLERKQLFVVESRSEGIIYMENVFTSHGAAQFITIHYHNNYYWQ